MKQTRREIIIKFLIDVKAVLIAFVIYIGTAFIAVEDAPEQDLAFGLISLLSTLLFLFICSFLVKERESFLLLRVPIILVYSFGTLAYLLGQGQDGWNHFGITLLLALMLMVCWVIYVITLVYLFFRKRKESENQNKQPVQTTE